MSIKLMTSVWATALDTTNKMVMLALADNANDEGICWPSMANIMRKTGLSDRSIQRSLSFVVKLNMLQVIIREGKSNYYIITDPRHWCAPTQSHPDTESPPPPTHRRETPDTLSPRTVIEPSVESSGARASRSPDFFDQPKPEEAPDVRAAEKTKSTRTAGGSRGRTLPHDWQPNDGHRKKCAAITLDIAKLIEEFTDYHTARGTVFKDWDAAFRTWISRAAGYGKTNQQGNAGGNRQRPASVVESGMRVAARFAGKVGQPI